MDDMDIKPPYLKAIQAINGKTPGQKLESINKIVTQIAKSVQEGGDIAKVIPSSNVPEGLEPLTRIEVANILKQHDGVIDALKNEDIVISSHALNARWFFEGTNKTIFNVDYFEENVFPHISLHTRLKVIRNMAMYLKDTTVAETFFIQITKKYGVAQAMPLLLACSETFIMPVIIERMIVLKPRLLSQLYYKYPAVVIEYLKMTKRDGSESRNIHNININNYKNFLPALIKNHLDAFIEIHEMHRTSERLSKTRTKLFLKSSTQKLLDDPTLWLGILSMEVVSKKLTKEQFETMFRKLFPKLKSDFYFDRMLTYLEHFEESDKLSYVLDAFEKVYRESLLDNEDKITQSLMKRLPTEERVKQARIKLEKDNDWHIHDSQASWRCYLTTSESVPEIKNQISKTSDPSERYGLLMQLVFTCQINDDRGALLDILKYFVKRHRNEEQWLRYKFLEGVMTSFEIPKLSAEYWSILNDCIMKGHVQDEFKTNEKEIKELLEKVIHHNCLNSLPIDKEIDWIIEMEASCWNSNWNIVKECPEIERKCLCMFLKRIPEKYSRVHKFWKIHSGKIVEHLTRSMYDFDSRNEKAKNPLERLSMKDYPWLLKKCKALVYDKTQLFNDTRDTIIGTLKANEKDLFHTWVKNRKAIRDYDEEEILEILVKEPDRILKNWKKYLRNAQKSMPSIKSKLFIKKSQWYQDIPIRIVKQCLADIKDTENVKTFLTLSLLLDGVTFTQVIEPYLPTGSEVVISENAKEHYQIISTISKCINEVNPPVSLEIIARFCVGDFLQLAMRFLTSISRLVPVKKVIAFAKSLVDRRDSVKKHAIRLVYLVASLEETRVFLNDLWKSEMHRSIREVLFTKMYDLFTKNPDQQSWKMMEDCIASLTNDDESIFNRLLVFDCIPNEYVTIYMQLLFSKISALEQNGYDAEKCLDMKCTLIKSPITSILPEGYCEELVTKYLFSFDSKSKLADAGKEFAINSYILSAGDKLELRMNFLGEHFKKCIGKYWNYPHPTISGYYPMNVMVHRFIECITSIACQKEFDVTILERLQIEFFSIVLPEEDFESYLVMIFTIEIQKSKSLEDFGERIGKEVPLLIIELTPECVIAIASRLHDFIMTARKLKDGGYSELAFSVIEALLAVGTIHTNIIAAKLLSYGKLETFSDRYKDIIRLLLEYRHSGVVSILSTCICNFNCND